MNKTVYYEAGRTHAVRKLGLVKAAQKYGPLGSHISKSEAAQVKSKVQAGSKKLPLDQFQKGLRTEFEHTKVPVVAGKISLDHLKESPRYYTELSKMEKKLNIK